MWHFLHFIVRPAEALLGVFCLVTAIVLYPNEEGRIQSRLEDFWMRLDDYRHVALSRHVIFLRNVAAIESQWLDYLFGQRLFSLQSFAGSASCSYASVFITGAFLRAVMYGFGERHPHYPVLIWLSGLVPVVAWAMVARFSRPPIIFIVNILIGAFALLFLYFIVAGVRVPISTAARMLVVLVVVCSFVSDFVFVAVTRRLLRLVERANNYIAIVVIVFVNFAVAACLTAFPAWWGVRLSTEHGPHSKAAILLFLSSSLNSVDAIIASVFGLFALLLLVHRVVWPLLTRTLFRIQDIGTKGRRAMLFTVGTGLLTLAGFGLPEWLKGIFKSFGG
jgi:hypothetical protein